ncbi:prepilin-type N-terminal cleavage/methylation domain-containing protein [Myxococcota bacterium]|nr:prepilin-type N-terminal cleavage/methylation domain-containing protein [Myxococcota bacterium]
MNSVFSALSSNTPRSGFTLIEVLGAVFLTSVVLAVAVSLQVNLSQQSERAIETMRVDLRASAVLDRVARDVSGASLLVRPNEEVDPNLHPWFFTASSRNAFGGSDAVKFISRNQRPSVSSSHISELAQIAYFTTTEEDGSVTLWRWSSPNLPPDYQSGFPGPDDPNSFIVAEDLGNVSFRFRSEDGNWVDEWDSKQLIQSDQLPTVVEIKVEPEVVEPDGEDFALNPRSYARQVILQQRPLNLTQMVEEKIQAQQIALANGTVAQDGDAKFDEDGNPIDDSAADSGNASSVGNCVQANLPACNQQFGAQNCLAWSKVRKLSISDFGVTLPPEWGCQ